MSGLYDAVDCCFFEDEWNLIKKAVKHYNSYRRNQYKSALKKREKEIKPDLRVRRPLIEPEEININDYISMKRLVRKAEILKARSRFAGSLDEGSSNESDINESDINELE